MTCNWVVREGTNNSLWAFTPCKPGFNYLSRVSKVESIRPEYENKECPICGRSIKIIFEPTMEVTGPDEYKKLVELKKEVMKKWRKECE